MIKTFTMPLAKTVLIFLFLSVCTAQTQAQTLIKNINLIDVDGQKIIPNQDVASVNGKIIYTGKGRMYKLPPGTIVIDGSNKYLLPGLTDAHVHFFQSGGLFTRPDAIDLRKYK